MIDDGKKKERETERKRKEKKERKKYILHTDAQDIATQSHRYSDISK